MRGSQRLLNTCNTLLRPANLRLRQIRPTNWDAAFAKWIKESRLQGTDPNAVGDTDWEDDRLQLGLDEWYLSNVTVESRIVELGPGSGRLTRHLIGRCNHLIVLDFSQAVCAWMNEYLAGKGSFGVRQIGNSQTELAASSIDHVLAHGVVEHLDQETLFDFLTEFARILRRGGTFVFTFDCLLSEFSRTYLDHQDPMEPERFRFYHPDAIRRLAEMTGFTSDIFYDGHRIAFASLTKL
jgi:SAM-dependent methyltransferase